MTPADVHARAAHQDAHGPPQRIAFVADLPRSAFGTPVPVAPPAEVP
jgi:hypothetical protein